MSINKKAVAEVDVEGADKAARDFDKVGAAGKRAGKDIADSFTGVGKALGMFGASVVDAVVDMKSLDPASMVRTFEDYSRSLTKTAISTGQSLDGLKSRYQDLSRANAVMPQSIDAFARSVGRMTYDIRGGIDAFTGLHNAALAFGETDQEQIGFAAYLKNVQGVAGDTTHAVGKLFAQAEKLGTIGGARALRDLFVSMGGAVDQLVSKVGSARATTEALAAILTKGSTGPQAQRIAGGALGFLGSSPLDIQRTLGKNLFDREGRYKDPLSVYQGLYGLMRKPVSEGGRGMDEERILLAFQASLGMEAGSAMYNALKSGQLGQARGLAKVGPLGTATAAGNAYRSSAIGQIDLSRIGIFEEQQKLAEPLFNMKSNIAGFVGEHPLVSLGLAYGVKAALAKALPKLAPKLLPSLMGAGLRGAAGPIGLAASVLDPTEGAQEEVSRTPLSELIRARAVGNAAGMNPDESAYGSRAAEVKAAESYLKNQGMNPATMSLADLKAALGSMTLKVEIQNGTSQAAESAKDPESRN